MTEELKPPEGNVPETPPEGTKEPEAELPDKWKGKSPAEIVRAHEELERKLGEQGRELGEYKKGYEQTQSELAYSRQAQTPQAPQPVESQDDKNTRFFADPMKVMDEQFRKYDSHRRYSDGARAFSSTLAELKRSEPDVFGDDQIVGMTRQFVDYGLKSGQLDPMIQADPNLLTAIGVNMKYQRDRQAGPNRTPVQPVATETPSAVRTNEPTEGKPDFSDKDKSLIAYLASRAPDVGIKDEKDAAELMKEYKDEEERQ